MRGRVHTHKTDVNYLHANVDSDIHTKGGYKKEYIHRQPQTSLHNILQYSFNNYYTRKQAHTCTHTGQGNLALIVS